MESIPEFSDDMEIIQKLSDYPEQDMMSTSQFKACFDKAGILIKTFINKYIVPAINNYVASQDGLLKVTGGTMTGDIAMGGNKVTGLGAPADAGDAANKAYVDDSVRKAAPRNLLDNSYFIKPVNQKGVVSFIGDGIDRWQQKYLNEAEVRNNGLYLPPLKWLLQKFKKNLEITKTYTLAVCLADGNIYFGSGLPKDSDDEYTGIKYVENIGYLEINRSSIRFVSYQEENACIVKWMALYEGTYTAETLPEYRPKGYMVEALNCGALHVTKPVTLPASGWADWGNSIYGQNVTVEGISSDDNPHIALNEWGDNWYTIKEEYSKIDRALTGENFITFQCYADRPTVDINILVEVNR